MYIRNLNFSLRVSTLPYVDDDIYREQLFDIDDFDGDSDSRGDGVPPSIPTVLSTTSQ